MTTASTVAAISQTSDAAFRAWVSEIITALVTTCGLTQTADTGQINTATVTRAGTTQTAAGYVILRFNDTLQATAPIFFKLEFGTGGTQPTDPAMWITVGTGSNGSGTITGTTTGRCPVGQNLTPLSLTTPYISRFCYASGASQGIAWMKVKNGAASAAQNVQQFFFVIARSTNSAGACTADSYILITNGASGAPGVLNSAQSATNYSYNTGALVAGSSATTYNQNPYTQTSTNINGNLQFFPVWHLQPTVSVLATIATALLADVPNDVEVVGLALVGATTHTFLQQGQFSNGTSIGVVSTAGLLLIWE